MRTITALSLLFAITLIAEAQQPVRYVVELQSAPALALVHHGRTASADAVTSRPVNRGSMSSYSIARNRIIMADAPNAARFSVAAMIDSYAALFERLVGASR